MSNNRKSTIGRRAERLSHGKYAIKNDEKLNRAFSKLKKPSTSPKEREVLEYRVERMLGMPSSRLL